MKKKLLIILNDILSDIIKKGELIDRYYNPGNLFDEVHILLLNDDKPDLNELKKSVGSAELFLYNLPFDGRLILRSLLYRPILLRLWNKKGIKLAQKIKPNVIRCHGNHLNAFMASNIKNKLGIPYIISIHTNPDMNSRKFITSTIEWILFFASKSIERISVEEADIVLPVYEAIIPYLEKYKIKNIEIAYNVLNLSFLKKKENYDLNNPIRILSVGRQYIAKNPINIIKAVKSLPNVHLTLIGNGPIHEQLKKYSAEIADRVTFISSMPNDVLAKELNEYDIFAIHTDCYELPKTILEAFVCGLPSVINVRPDGNNYEYNSNIIAMVNNTHEGYRDVFEKIIKDKGYRESLGRNAFKEAQKKWIPEVTEKKYVEIYSKYLQD